MTITINNIRADFHLVPPVITFLQGALMQVPSIRDTLRQIEETEEGRSQPFPNIVNASGNVDFSETQDGSSLSALTVRVLSPYVCAFEAGPIPFSTTLGNILFTAVQSPGAMVKINNAVGAMLVSTGGAIPTPADLADAVWDEIRSEHVLAGSTGQAQGRIDAAVSSRAQAGEGLTAEQFTMLYKLFAVMGLDRAKPLVAATTYRRVPADGSIINQIIATDDQEVVTVTNQ